MSRQLILHADELGLCHAANAATIHTFEQGAVNSGSIMVPCPWFGEIAAYARSHPDADLGIHITLTNEWDHYRWRPVAPAAQVPTLVDERGFLHDLQQIARESLDPVELETELRAQIDRAQAFGIRPTHIDAHDFVAMRRRESLAVYLSVAREYGLPALFHPEFVHNTLGVDPTGLYRPSYLWIDHVVMAFPDDYSAGLEHFYLKTIRELSEGVTVLLVHPGYDSPELQAITGDNIDCGSPWRQRDHDFLASEACSQALADSGVELVTWRELASLR